MFELWGRGPGVGWWRRRRFGQLRVAIQREHEQNGRVVDLLVIGTNDRGQTAQAP
jgi:hypothetical protein